jgi:hypothetical protein
MSSATNKQVFERCIAQWQPAHCWAANLAWKCLKGANLGEAAPAQHSTSTATALLLLLGWWCWVLATRSHHAACFPRFEKAT